MSIYARLIVHHPFKVLILLTILSIVCTIVPLLLKTFPNFSNPTLGFETRGTTLANRFIAWENLLEETRPSKSLAANPQDIIDEMKHSKKYNATMRRLIQTYKKKRKQKHFSRKNKTNSTSAVVITEFDMSNDTFDDHDHWSYGKNSTYLENATRIRRNRTRQQWVSLRSLEPPLQTFTKKVQDGFCGVPVSDYAHIALSTVDGSSMMSFKNIQRLCHIQYYLMEVGSKSYKQQCQRPLDDELDCCLPWSLPNYIALFSNRSSCLEIQEDDVVNTLKLLIDCASYFHSLKLATDCEIEFCSTPAHCYKYNGVYNMLYFLLDVNFLPPSNYTQTHLETTMIFFPLACSSTTLPFYNQIKDARLEDENVKVVAMELGVKNAVFDSWLIQDTWLVGLSAIFILFCIWIYTESLFLTLSSCCAILFSLAIAYFMYVMVYNLEFFPFMNLLVIVIIIGIGADDVFLFLKIWQTSKKTYLESNVTSEAAVNQSMSNSTLILVVDETVRQASVKMFVTTITTAVAFFASCISFITAVNCFSIFAGTAVLVNYIFALTWLPTCVVISEKHFKVFQSESWKMKLQPMNSAISEMWSILGRFIVISVIKLRIFWIILFGSIGILCGVLVFYYPRLQLPNSPNFQLFSDSHLFEQYDAIYRNKFWFERSSKDWGPGTKMPLRWVWGVDAVDNGNQMNPTSRGSLVLNPHFNISDKDSQSWLFDFCDRLKAQPFYQLTLGPLLPNCFIENFRSWMGRRCYDEIDEIDRAPCCDVSEFPYPSEIFDICIVKAVSSLYQTSKEFFIPGVAGPKFKRGSTEPKVVALVVEFESVQPFTLSYEEMYNFFNEVETWTKVELETAPPGMRNGWFISELYFYDLQATLAKGTLIALSLSSVLALFVLIPATLNALVSICAFLTVALTVLVTIGILVLSGWQLNTLESIAVSTSVGLSIDFSLHYTLCFTTAPGTSLNRVKSAIAIAAGPTAAAAITTGAAGLFLLPSRVLPYSKIGLFLVLIMMTSWTYATWFLCSLLSFCEKRSVTPRRGASERRSASAASTVCSGIPPSESHELERLAIMMNQAPISHNNYSPSSRSTLGMTGNDAIENLSRSQDPPFAMNVDRSGS